MIYFFFVLQEEWVICRIYHKVGEKKNNQLNETPRTQSKLHAPQNQNIFLNQNQESDLEFIINPVVSHSSANRDRRNQRIDEQFCYQTIHNRG